MTTLPAGHSIEPLKQLPRHKSCVRLSTRSATHSRCDLMADGGAEGAGGHFHLVHPNLHMPHMPVVPIPHMPEVHMPQRPRLSKSGKSRRFGSFMIRGSNFGRQSTVGIGTMLKNISSFRKATGDGRRRSSAVAPLEWEPEDEAELLAPGEPKQLLRAASPAMMKWLLRYLVSLGADEYTLTTHDAVHGEGAKWEKKLHKKHGFGYPPPTCKACIREITRAAQTNLYYFLTQREEGASLRQELQKEFVRRRSHHEHGRLRSCALPVRIWHPQPLHSLTLVSRSSFVRRATGGGTSASGAPRTSSATAGTCLSAASSTPCPACRRTRSYGTTSSPLISMATRDRRRHARG